MENDRVLLSLSLRIAQAANADARRQTDVPTGDQTLAWQRELAQAQADGFASWFSPVAASAHVPVAPLSHGVPDTGMPADRAQGAKYTGSAGSAPIAGAGRNIRSVQASRERVDLENRSVPRLDAFATLPVTGSVPATLVPSLSPPPDPVTISTAGLPSTPSSLQAWLTASLGTPVERVDAPSETLRAVVHAAPDDDGTEADPDPEPLQSTEPQRGAPRPPDPMRVYAEWSEDGVRVWLGADTERLADVARVARILRDQLRQQGVRLHAVVCNGTDISLCDGTAAETTAGFSPLTDSSRF
ncbi:hypothetical protein [Burkholderia paludis]|uniref:hypothetical protein n=1 Tax=Burkholderia paludis TaxID=1506587 RepID=UPI00126A39A9|nr:hypothetical protein [Burkholderia paludis]